jgi:hypothetical protein
VALARTIGEQLGRRDGWGPSLGYGSAGLALLFKELMETGQDRRLDEERWRASLVASAEGLETTPLPPGLLAGVAGVAWVLAQADGPWVGSRDDLRDLDEHLAEFVAREPWSESFVTAVRTGGGA